MRFGRSVFGAVLAWGGIAAAVPAAVAAESAGCAFTNGSSIFSPPNGYNGSIAVTNNYLDHSNAYASGEKLTLSLVDADIEGTMTVTLRNSADTVTYLSVVLVDGVSTTVTLPDGAVGLRFQDTAPGVVTVTKLVISCTAVPDAPAEETSDADVGNDLKQAAELTTAQTSALAVTNFSNFINAAVARRFTAGPAGVPPAFSETAHGQPDDTWAQVASLLPADALVAGVQQVLGDGGTDRLLLAGAQLADNVLDAANRPFGIWVNGAATFVDYDRAGGAYSGHVLSLGGGADYQIDDGLLAGLALAYERGNIDTTFNTGDLISNGVSIAPYVGWQPLPDLTLDANAGISLLNYDTARSGGTVTAGYDALRVFGSVNASGSFRFEGLRLSPLAGVLYFQERQDPYTDSTGTAVAGQTVRLGRFSGGLEAGYTVMVYEAFGVEPYMRLEGEWDFVRPGSVILTTGEIVRPGQYGGSVAGGLNLFDGSGFTGNVEASLDSIGRADYDSLTLQGTLRFAF